MSITDQIVINTPSFRLISREEQEVAKAALEQLDRLQGEGGVALSPPVLELLVDTLRMAADGQVVTGLSSETELTIRQAAELLCVSEPYLLKLLESGDLRFQGQAGNCRILLKDLLEYREEKKALRLNVLSELVAESQEAGAY